MAGIALGRAMPALFSPGMPFELPPRHGCRKFWQHMTTTSRLRFARSARAFPVLLIVLAILRASRTEADDAAQSSKYFVYIGTYTTKGSKGIYVSRFDAATGDISTPELATEGGNPCFLAVFPDQHHLLSAADTIQADGRTNSGMASFTIDRETGKLTLVNTRFCGWRADCHVAVDPTAHCALAASYTDGCVASAPLSADGTIGEVTSLIRHHGSGPNPARQAGPHAHQVVIDPADQHVLVCDLGLDRIMSYRFDPAAGTLATNDPPYTKVGPGTGPRHLAFHPNGRIAYVVSELANTVTACAYDGAGGTLSPVQIVSTLPPGYEGTNTAAEVAVHPSGKFLYASNRGHNSVELFRIDPASGLLSPVQDEPTQGRTPRFIAIDPTGRFLFVANQDSDNVVIFRINGDDGRLTPTGVQIKASLPVCVAFVRAD
jgi:6-phosphogluconolactonase